jgi:hypothetical protein
MGDLDLDLNPDTKVEPGCANPGIKQPDHDEASKDREPLESGEGIPSTTSGGKDSGSNQSLPKGDRTGGKRAKVDKKLPLRNHLEVGPGVFGQRPGDKELRGRRPVVNGTEHTFCPKADYVNFMQQLDEVIKLDDRLSEIKDQTAELVTRIYKYYGWDSPKVDSSFTLKNKRYQEVIRAFFDIKRMLSRSGVRQSAEFEYLIAALEVVGCIILNPEALSYTETYQDGNGRIAFLATNKFTTEWTQNRIEKIQWNSEGEITFHRIQRSRVSFNYFD